MTRSLLTADVLTITGADHEFLTVLNEHATALNTLEANPPGGDWILVTDHLSDARVAGVSDDRAGIIDAIAAAIADNAVLFFPPGLYRVSKYIDILGAVGLQIWGNNARIIFASDDTAVTTDSVATTNNMVRSCFLLRYCSDVTIEGITFEGGNHPNLVRNTGCGIYATHCVDTKVYNCNELYGHSLVFQDALAATTGTGDSLTVASGVVTVSDTTGSGNSAFKAGHTRGRYITIANASNPVNNGTFPIISYVSASSITYANADAVTETSSFRWTIDDNDRGLRVRGGRSYGCRLYTAPTNDSVIDGHTFELPEHGDVIGVGGEFTFNGSTVTLKTWHPGATTKLVGKYITIRGATTAANNGTFLITGVTPRNGHTVVGTITWTNTSAVAELYTGNWWVLGGDKHGLGAGAGSLKSTGKITCVAKASLADTDTVTVNDNVNPAVVYEFDTAGDGVTGGRTQVNVSTDTTANEVAARLRTAILAAQPTLSVTDNGDGTLTVTAPTGARISLTEAVTNSGFSVTNGLVVFTASTSTFHASDLYKTILLAESSEANNRVEYTIEGVTSATTVTWRGTGVVSEDYSGTFLVDRYDRSDSSGTSHGSSHAIYGFSGRNNIKVVNCTFRDLRTEAVKFSGSTSPIENCTVENCTFYRCGMIGAWGADDSQQHNNLKFVNNSLVDCGTTRGSGGQTLNIVGSSNIQIRGNSLHYTQNAWGARSGGTPPALYGFEVERYNPGGWGQPCESVDISNNMFTCDPQHTQFGKIILGGIKAEEVGIRAYWSTSGTLTKSGGTFTADAATDLLSRSGHGLTTGVKVRVSTTGTLPAPLAAATDYYVIYVAAGTFKLATSQANAVAGTAIDLTDAGTGTHTVTDNVMTLSSITKASGQWVGRTIDIVNAPDAGNNGSFVITGLSNTNTITFVNVNGVGGGVSAGTWRVHPALRTTGTHTGIEDMGGTLRICNNYFEGLSDTFITMKNNVAPIVTGNVITSSSYITDTGSLQPYIDDNVWLGNVSRNTATIQLNNPVWPLVGSRNRVANSLHFSPSVTARGPMVGVGATPTDFPLLGFRGYARATDGYEEAVFAYGNNRLVDGDTFSVTVSGSTTTFTYKQTSPGASEFNSQASLITLISAVAGVTAEDYGTPWGITTGHVIVRLTSRTTADGTLSIGSKTLNPIGLVVLRNRDAVVNQVCQGRGSASAGPIPDKIVAWTPLANHTGQVTVVPENAAALPITAGSYLQARNSQDAGACAVIQFANRTDDGALTDLGGQWRWAVTA